MSMQTISPRKARRTLGGRGGGAAFTLIELLVVIAIIALLIGLLVPALSGARAQARKVATQAQLADIGKSCEMYFNDFGAYPGMYTDGQLATANNTAKNFSAAQELAVCLNLRWVPSPGLPAGNAAWIRLVAGNPATFIAVSKDRNLRPQRHSYTGSSTEYAPYYAMKAEQFSNASHNQYFGGSVAANLADVPCFVDAAYKSASMPILYYRASSSIAPGNTNGPITATDVYPGNNVTSSTFYSAVNSPINGAPTAAAPGNYGPFEKMVCNENTTAGQYDVPKGQFVLVSAGEDRLYGTDDDVIVSGGH